MQVWVSDGPMDRAVVDSTRQVEFPGTSAWATALENRCVVRLN